MRLRGGRRCGPLPPNLLTPHHRFDGMKIVDGHITLPDRPGLGIVPL